MELAITMLCLVGMLMTLDIVIGNLYYRDKLNESHRNELPNFNSRGPTNVRVMVFIHNMDSINEATMDYSMTIYLRLWWDDLRLAFPDTVPSPLQLDRNTMDMLWIPDMYFVNEKRGEFHEITVPNKLMHIYRNGTVFYSTRISLTLSCYMDLSKYPLDSQTCPIQMESYAYTADSLMFQWEQPLPIDYSQELQLPHFRLIDITSDECTKAYGTAGNFTCLIAEMTLQRNIGYYLCQIYAPSLLVVLLSWVSFWINVDVVPARITLGVLTVLMITSQTTGFSNSLPKVSYVKAIDVWMAMCLVFVFSALIEFSIVNIYTRGGNVKVNVDFRKTMRKGKRKENSNSQTKAELQSETAAADDLYELQLKEKQREKLDRKRAERVDKCARGLFPLMFILFNIVYWSVLAMI